MLLVHSHTYHIHTVLESVGSWLQINNLHLFSLISYLFKIYQQHVSIPVMESDQLMYYR
uniref:Uncharacterized protein n=1 Tax=Oryza brachyantha TaxID=4533 RepID=J3LA38_ORYBR